VQGRVIKWQQNQESPNSFNGLVEDRYANWFGFRTLDVVEAGYQNGDIFIGDLLEFEEGPIRTGARGRQVRTAVNIRVCTRAR
jgi:hypothetical protein